MTEFNGRIRLYWQGFEDKPDRIVEVRDPYMRAAFQIVHGLQTLEEQEKWQNATAFQTMRDEMDWKIEVYVDRLRRLFRLGDNWDWDWIQSTDKKEEGTCY